MSSKPKPVKKPAAPAPAKKPPAAQAKAPAAAKAPPVAVVKPKKLTPPNITSVGKTVLVVDPALGTDHPQPGIVTHLTASGKIGVSVFPDLRTTMASVMRLPAVWHRDDARAGEPYWYKPGDPV